MIHPSHRTAVPMLLRAIIAAAVVFSLTAVPRLPAQDSSKAGQPSKGPPTAIMVSGPDVGRRAPTFRLPWASTEGVGPADQPYDLALDRGKTVVLAFYPRDFTTSSTTEMRTFAEQYDSLFGSDVVVVGISTDPLETHSRFAASLNLPFRLLSDPTQEVARRYASNDRSGYLRRTVYVVGPDGKVQYRNLRFNVLNPKHYAELGAAVRRSRGG
jgi:thioredoxin-dependent peroxiredoxin